MCMSGHSKHPSHTRTGPQARWGGLHIAAVICAVLGFLATSQVMVGGLESLPEHIREHPYTNFVLPVRKNKAREEVKPIPPPKKQNFWGRLLRKKEKQAKGYPGPLTPHEQALYDEMTRQIEGRPSMRRQAEDVGLALDRAGVLRFLELVYWKIEGKHGHLLDRIQDTIDWRRSYGTDDITLDDIPFEAASGMTYVNGFDRQQRPLIVFRPADQPDPFDVENVTRLLVYTLESAVDQLPKGQDKVGVIVDCAHFKLSMIPPFEFIRKAVDMIQTHFPMRLGWVRLVNAGVAMTLSWKLISPLLQERTRAKIDFIGKGEQANHLRKLVHPDTLEVKLGGTNTKVFRTVES
ncbi:unnamed protein product [Chrysoparadoxa australica]